MRKYSNNKGQVLLGIILLFLLVSSTIVFGAAHAIYFQLRSIIDFSSSRSSYYLAEALNEDVVYRFIKGYALNSTATISFNGKTASAVIRDIARGKEIVSSANWSGIFRSVRIKMTYGSGGSFYYGLQIGEGGLRMFNTSSVVGNVFSSGPVIGVGNYIYGDVLSAGPAGLIDNIHATSSAYAHTVQNSVIDKDAYYVNLTNTTVGGTKYPNSPDQATTSLPITDEEIDGWEADAANGGTVTCTDGKYVISGTATIGPKKIPCNLYISSNETITLTGALWVVGNIDISNNPIIRISPIYTDVVIPIIADNPSNRLNGSTISLDNSAIFEGSGSNSYVLIISRNTSAEQGGSVDAIIARNSMQGEVLLYAPHGNVTMDNTVNLREVTSYKLTLRNSAKVRYKSGLANVVFTSGPSGGFEIIDWREVE